ncbi:MAG: GPP34 family phosphoprotein [Bacteroidota bacterium]
MDHLLTIPEELFLLTVNENTGRRAFVKSKKFDFMLSASILMDLALHNRIDTDPDDVIPDRPDPTGHPLLDAALELIRNTPEQQKISWWLLRLSENAGRYREMLVSGLVGKGLLKMEKERVFLGFTTSRYPILIRDREVKEVKTRIRELIFSNDLPDFRDVVIISLAWYGGLLNLFLREEEIRANLERIEKLAKLDLIGQAVSKSMREITRSIVLSMVAKDILGIKTPEEKLEELVEELKALMHIGRDADLPEWLRKGTDQYRKTLDYIRETGTNEIVFNAKTGQYGLKAGAGQRLSF